jgi:uncharacterized membrane protein
MFRSKFARDERGAVAMTVALCSGLVLGFAAVAIDMGSVFLETRQLQGIADLAAIAAASDINNAQAAAQATVKANGFNGPVTIQLVTGTYVADPNTPQSQRFAPGATPANAVRVTLGGQAELFFGQAILGKSTLPISRTATAAQAQMATFSIGTRLAAVNGGVANGLLSALTGSQVNLSVMDYNALTTANIDLFQYSKALATKVNLQGASFNQVLASNISTRTALQVFANQLTAAGDSAGATAVNELAAAASNTVPANLSQLIDLGPYGDQDNVSGGSGAGATVNALDMANAMLLLAQGGRQVQVDLGAGVPGLTNTTLYLAVGQRPNSSPWLTVAANGSETIRTAQTRLYIDSKVAPTGVLGALGVAQVDLPVLVEAASAQAKLSSIDCAAGSANVAVEPSVGSLIIGQINTATLNDFNDPLSVSPAQFLTLPLISASGSAQVNIGGASWQPVDFSGADIAAGTVKTVSTDDIAAATVGSLVGNLNLRVNVAGLGLLVGNNAATAAVGSVLSTAATPVDGLLDGLTDLLGVHLGEADVRVGGVRCGDAALVA